MRRTQRLCVALTHACKRIRGGAGRAGNAAGRPFSGNASTIMPPDIYGDVGRHDSTGFSRKYSPRVSVRGAHTHVYQGALEEAVRAGNVAARVFSSKADTIMHPDIYGDVGGDMLVPAFPANTKRPGRLGSTIRQLFEKPFENPVFKLFWAGQLFEKPFGKPFGAGQPFEKPFEKPFG